jgi:hypothetical protein
MEGVDAFEATHGGGCRSLVGIGFVLLWLSEAVG